MIKKRDDNGLTQHATALAVPIGLAFGAWAVVCFLISRKLSISVNLASLIIFLHWAIIAYLTWLLVSRPSGAYLSSPSVKQIRDEGRVLMVGNAPWLGLRVQVSVFIMDGEFERQVSLGYVKNVQGNKLVQIQVVMEESSKNPFESVDLEKIIIKPGLVAEAL